MIPYLILLGLVTVIAYFGRYYCDQVLRRFSIFLVGGTLILFAGLRSWRVGTDSGTYVMMFHASQDFDYVLDKEEIGFYLLSWSVRSFSDSYLFLFIVISLVVVFCHLNTIFHLVKRYETAIFLFVALGGYTFFFNAARQGVAVAICFFALPFLLKRKVLPYVLLVMIAVSFHRTAIIALPLYWVASPRVNWKNIIVLGFITSIAVVFLSAFVGLATDFLSERYSNYADAGDGGGEVWAAFLVSQGVVLYYLKRVVTDSCEWYGRLLNIYLLGLVPALVSTITGVNPSGVLRLHVYFSSTAILLWPMVFQQLGTNFFRLSLALPFFSTIFLFYIMTTSSFSGLVPYSLNPSVIPW